MDKYLLLDIRDAVIWFVISVPILWGIGFLLLLPFYLVSHP
jgi:hypothetical protein